VTHQSQNDDRTALVKFFGSLRHTKAFEPIRDLVRVVSKGLFVDERGVEAVVELYRAWILEESKGVAQKTHEKCRQRLFGEQQPIRQYLVEGKSVLAGFLVSAPVSDPHQFGLPYYLGSLLSTQNYIHPADPLLKSIKGVEFKHGKGGLEAIVQRRGGAITVSDGILKSFLNIAGTSRFLQRRYPGIEGNLSICLRVLIGLVRRSRTVPRTFPIIVPFDVRSSKTRNIRAAGKFLFVEEKGALLRIIELNGRNLSGFLREELVRAPKEKLGSFKLTPKHRDLMGFYELRGHRSSVHARAYGEFAELVRRAREPRERFSGWFTSAECFEKFSSFYQLAQPIEKRKISGALERFGVSGESFKIHGGWIFVLSREQTVMRVIAKHIRLPGHRRSRV
jgi:hypothetical protein